jgi:hypothetical protein
LRVSTPLTDALIDLTQAITGADYRSSARTLKRLGLSGLDAKALRARLR